MEFGKTPDSAEPTGGNEIRVRALNRVRDLHGNAYEISYRQYSGGDIYPDTIRYTIATGVSAEHTVKFVYETRNDTAIDLMGSPGPRTVYYSRRLKWIEIRSNGDLVRKYKLYYGHTGTAGTLVDADTYAPSTGRSRLTAIQEFGSDGISTLPAETFAYQDGGILESRTQHPIAHLPYDGWREESMFLAGDFDGDGISDLLWRAFDGADYDPNRPEGSRYRAHFWIGLNRNGAFTPLHVYGPWGNYDWGGFRIADFNGDGKVDILSQVEKGFTVFYSTGASIVQGPTISDVMWSAAHSEPSRIRLVDFNGDGKIDIIHHRQTEIVAWLSDGASFRRVVLHTPAYPSPANELHHDTWPAARLGDFNGDGKADIFTYWTPTGSSDGEIVLSASQGEAIFRYFSYLGGGHAGMLQCGWWDFTNSNQAIGDFNGDGKLDFFSVNAQVTACLSDGPAYSIGSSVIVPPLSQTYNPFIDHYTRWADVNGDGRTDILQVGHPGPAYDGLPSGVAWLSHGKTVSTPATFLTTFISTAQAITGDFDGDGKTDIIYPDIYPDLAYDEYALVRSSSGIPDLLISIGNGAGGTTEISYKPAPQVTGAVVPSATNYPSIADSSPRYLVTSVISKDGRGASYRTDYQYYNGKLTTGTIDQRRDQGFEWVREINVQTGAFTQTWYDQEDPTMAYSVLKSESFAGGPLPQPILAPDYTRLMSRTEYTYTVAGSQSATVPLVQAQVTRTYEAGSLVYTRSQTILYDTAGNMRALPRTVTDYADGTETTVTELQYAPPDGVNWITNRLTQITTRTASISGPILNQTQFIYDGTCGNPHNMCKRNDWLNTPTAKWITTSFAYDTYGNVTDITDPLGHVSHIEYDPVFHSQPVRVRNALGHEVVSVFDARYGALLSKVDPNGGVVEQVLDVFGRPVESRVNGLLTQMILYNDHLTGNANQQFVETRITDDTAPGGYTFARDYYDGLGRTYKKESAGPNLAGIFHTVVTETGFDVAGRKAAESHPYLAPRDLPVFTSYEYDAVGRVNFIYYPEGTYTEIIYSVDSGARQKITEEYDANGNSKVSYRDSRGRLVRTIEGGIATVRHEYDALGQLSRVTDADGLVTHIHYDSLGRKVSMTEPNTGSWSYAYDDAGNLVEQTDPKGQKITFQYDALSRLTQKILPGGGGTSVQYGYDNALVNGKGLLTSINDAAGLTEYSYDNRGNMSAWRQTIAGKTYSFQATYDLQNRPIRLTYPDGEFTENYYAESGYLRQVRLKNPDKVWGAPVVTYSGPEQTADPNVLQLTRIAGNNVTTQIGFDRRTHKAVSVQTRLADASHTLVEHVAFEPDAVGNIVSMTDNLNANRTQNFGYDSLYRLTNAQSTAYGNLTYSYTPGGNLLNKTGMAYSYGNPQHPQAVTQAGSHTFVYDANANMVKRNIAAQPAQDLVYDAEDRLTQITVAGVTKHSFTYDHSGQRVVKQREDGTTVTYLSGLYEVLRLPDASERHTKYIFGIAGERVAQITRDGASVSVAMQDIHNQNLLALSSFHSGTLGTFLNVYYGAQYLFANTRVMKRVLLLAFFLATLALLFQILRSRLRKEYNVYAESHPAMASVAPMVLAFALFEFGFLGCAGSSTTIENATPWSDLPPSPPGSPDDVSNGTLSDTTQRGFPVLGAYFMHPNHVGSPALITNAAGTQALTQITYKPYGEIVRNNAYSHGADITRYKFTGQEEDAETGLMYFNARYYDPAIARLITSDSEFGGQGTQGFNRHMYATGNPIKYTDPTGHSSEDPDRYVEVGRSKPIEIKAEKSAGDGGRQEPSHDSNGYESNGGGQADAAAGREESGSHEAREMPDHGDRAPASFSNGVDNSQLTSIVQAVTMTQFTAGLPGAQAARYIPKFPGDTGPADYGDSGSTDSSSKMPTYAKITVAAVFALGLAAGTYYGFRSGRLSGIVPTANRWAQNVAGLFNRNAPKGVDVGQRIAAGHAFEKHVLARGEFTGLALRTRAQAADFIKNVIRNARGANVRSLSGGRTAYWDPNTGTVVIHNPAAGDLGTFFRPINGRAYFEGLR